MVTLHVSPGCSPNDMGLADERPSSDRSAHSAGSTGPIRDIPAARSDRSGRATQAGRPTRWTRGAAQWCVQVVGWMVLLAVVAALVAGVLLPRLVGATPYTVLTGSMAPTYPPGTLVVVRPTDPDDIQIGDAITFQAESGKSTVLTHRVIGTRRDDSGHREFLVKGDANQAADAGAVRAEQVRGRVWYGIPGLGRANLWLTGQARQLAVDLTAAGLIGYALLMFGRAVRERRRTAGAHRG